MKLPSIREAVQEARNTLYRFPFVIADAALGTVAALILIDFEGPPQPTILFNILLAAILGIPLLTALVLLAERKRWGMSMALGVQGVGLLLLAGYAFSVPTNLPNAPAITILRFLILAVALLLFVAAAPFARKGELNGFWHYNKALFLRLLMAILYSLVLYAGLAVALAALDNLFGVHIPGKRYGELWVLINGLFTTWFFLAGVPDDLARLETLTDYPKGLKVFAQYTLFPLVLVYLVILYAYLGKILVAWDWPQGWVSKLILGFSGTGIFSLLLLHPITGRVENVWIKTAARWFYVILIPLVVMLFFAVWRRVSEYGITEGRYLAIALGAWLVAIVLYFTLSKVKSIKFIPASLCVLAFAVSFGPWGTFAVSERSQIQRLRALLERTAILSDGKVRQVHTEVPVEDAKQISSVLSYLHEIHGYDGIQGWFGESLTQDSIGTGVVYKQPAVVTQMLGFAYASDWQKSPEGITTLNAESDGAFEVVGYERMIRSQHIRNANERRQLPGEGITYRMNNGMDTLTFIAVRDGKERELLQIDLRGHLKKLLKEYSNAGAAGIPPEKMAISGAGEGFKVKVCLYQAQLRRRGQEVEPVMYHADILYSVETNK